MSEFKHVDDFIDYGRMSADEPESETYARWVLNYFRMPAILKNDFKRFMKDSLLFCTYKGTDYRVTGASRMGDVWLTSDFNQETGYEQRVNVSDCDNWRSSPQEWRGKQ